MHSYKLQNLSISPLSPLFLSPCTQHPSTNKTVQFMDFIYLSQVVQGLCIKAEAEHYRRLLSEENALTRGTLYWQLVCATLCYVCQRQVENMMEVW